jgi:hypothetical protein
VTPETTSPSSRRAVLIGAVGGALGLIAGSLGRPAPAKADDGDPILAGSLTNATARTWLSATTADSALVVQNSVGGGVRVVSTGDGEGVSVEANGGNGVSGMSETGMGVAGISFGSAAGVSGTSISGVGVWANGQGDEPAVDAFSNGGPGVHAASGGDGIAASVGRGNSASTGVLGYSGTGNLPAAKAKTGVFGQATQDANSRGVWGYSPAGQGIRGEATTGRGVHGQATTGIGVRGFAAAGTGLSGESTTGYALRTTGRVRLDNSAGQATIASGTSSVVVTPGVDLVATSAVVATLNGDAGGSTAVKRVAINTTANTFTIYLTGNAATTVKAAWIVLG